MLASSIRTDHHLKHADASLLVVQAQGVVSVAVRSQHSVEGVEKAEWEVWFGVWRRLGVEVYGRLCWHLRFVRAIN